MIGLDVLHNWFVEQQREVMRWAISVYAAANAGSEADLDPVLECATVEYLCAMTDGRR
ncbi:MAG TPA: hypothetical protein VFF73_30500 [Planctomycetota bacterium]|nr:hypothetical protein [Planctomycetota bacterium]